MIKTSLAALALAFAAAPVAAVTYTNATPVVIPDSGEATSSILIAGTTGTITSLTVTLNSLTHTFPDDLVFGLLNEDLGLGFVFMSGAGGGVDVNGVTLTFSDAAASTLPESFVGGGIVSGTYLPSNYLGFEFTFFDNATNFAGFNGFSANGTWTLFADDTAALDIGGLAGGFSLDITTNAGPGVPEPATWALMIGGFGLTGTTLRRRRRATLPVLAA